MGFQRTATAVWHGSLKEGSGTVSTESGALASVPYGFRNRFENEPGTNPEELIGAAHAGCFSMAFSAELGKVGITPERIETVATVHLDFVEGTPTVVSSALAVKVRAPGASVDQIMSAGNAAKGGCPISRLLNADITMELSIEPA